MGNDNNVISSKIFRRVMMILKFAAVIILIMVIANSAWYSVEEEEQAVVCTFGQARAITQPGLHFKIPFIQTVQKVNTTIQGMPIGYQIEEPDSEEAVGIAEEESMMITGDYNFIRVDFYAEYRISDPVKAVYASEDPVLILNNIAQNCIRSTIGSYKVDSILTTGKNEIQANIKEMIITKLKEYDIGIQLVNITIQDAEPPTAEVSNAFKAVETAKQGKETALNNANKYRNEQRPKAEAQADKIRQDAQAQKENRINEAKGQVARFNSMYEEYVKYPTITKERMFYEAMEEILPDMKIIIEGTQGNTISEILPLDSFDSAGTTAGAVVGTTTGTNSEAAEEEEE